MKVGDQVICNGYIGTITNVQDGKFTDRIFVTVRTPHGERHAPARDVARATEKFDAFQKWVAENPNAKVKVRCAAQEDFFSKEFLQPQEMLAQVAESKVICGQISFEHLEWIFNDVDPEAYASTVRGMMLLANCTEQQARTYVDRILANREKS